MPRRRVIQCDGLPGQAGHQGPDPDADVQTDLTGVRYRNDLQYKNIDKPPYFDTISD